ncbi:MAG: hypothetical protein HUK02_07735 [Bacteroidaceae bacterium]|nr:hypothetical protein [Bacteroidaceae bacterium]
MKTPNVIDYLCTTQQTAVHYLVIGVLITCGLFVFPPTGGYIWDKWVINCTIGLLFTLLVFLTARLVNTGNTPAGVLLTALFLILFCPGAERFFQRDEQGVLELSSQCIVPFFISQYLRVSRKDFGRWYFLMALMGIFCSYTHNGITVPLCAAFVYLSFLHRKQFFRRACWPMVVGFVIGTGLSIWRMSTESLTMATDAQAITSVTKIALYTLWDTKVFVASLGLTLYLASTRHGRRILVALARRHYVISACCCMALITLPFAPLGIDNAVTGICFFSMLWVLLLCQHITWIYLHKRI